VGAVRSNPNGIRNRARCLVMALALAAALSGPAWAQQKRAGVLAAGNAAVTGFSGVTPPVQIAPGVNPADKTLIDLNGPSLRIVDLQHMGGPPAAQLVAAAKPATWFAAQTGQVFAVAVDNDSPPNIYAAATSAYGLPIVVPGPTGESVHVRMGAPGATFMPGLWGGIANGGPGSIWKIDGVTGAVSLFANVKADGRSNSGPALGGLAFDADSNSLYAADRETGFIHRFALDGSVQRHYDHGTVGRQAQGLPPVAFDPARTLDITSAKFDSADATTWNYAAPERRAFGLAVYKHRLYYAIAAGLQIWSVGLGPDGSFGSDAMLEAVVPPGAGPTEISKIVFDEQGRMVLAERPAPNGAFDFEALTAPGIGRVLRYANTVADPKVAFSWQPQPDEYAIGFPLNLRNGNGGIDVGYLYKANGDIDLGVCGGYLWTTGEQLRKSSDPSLAARLRQSGPENVDGLQGNGTWRIRRGDEPPLLSYFIDDDDNFDDEAARGHMGDIAISRLCTPAQRAELLPRPFNSAPPSGNIPPSGGNPPSANPPPPSPPPPPPPLPLPPPPPPTPPGCMRPSVMVGGQCCSPQDLAPGGACASSRCAAGQTPIGPSNSCCSNNQVYVGAGGVQACCSGQVVKGQCGQQPTPKCTPDPANPQCCVGYVFGGGACCLVTQMTSTGICCPSGQGPSGPNKSQCQPVTLVPIGPQCCAAGQTLARNGACCPAANITSTGICCLEAITTPNRLNCPAQTQVIIKVCASGYTKMPDGSCCNNRFIGADGKSCELNRLSCPPGEFRNASGICVPIPSASCPPGQFRDATGTCLPIPSASCPPGERRNREGTCEPIPTTECPRGEVRNSNGACVRVELPPPIVRPVVPRRPIMPPPPPPPPRRLGPSPPIGPPHGPIFRGPLGPAPFRR
jgi:hypothetical protein